jgi:hypothetical protein
MMERLMGNKYGLPQADVDRVRARDAHCVYCRKAMIEPGVRGSSTRDWATIEHLNHLPPWDNPETIAICCGSCNSSRGPKPLMQWFGSPYCQQRGISPSTVARAVVDYIRKHEGYDG